MTIRDNFGKIKDVEASNSTKNDQKARLFRASLRQTDGGLEGKFIYD
jgi:hypothetical protein